MSSPSSSTRPVIQPPSDQLVHPVEGAQKGGLAAPRRADQRVHLVGRERQRHALHRGELAVHRGELVGLDADARSAILPGAARGTARCAARAQPLSEPPADREPRADAQHEDHQDQDQRRGPGVPVPLLVGAGRVGEHRERQRRHRLVQLEAQILAAERGEEERRRLAGDAGDREQAPGDDAGQRGAHDDARGWCASAGTRAPAPPRAANWAPA